jgi:ATP-dependent Lon protease
VHHTRDRDGVQKTFSGLMKLLFPGGGATPEKIKELLSLSMEGRKRVKDQLMRIDSTYPEVEFSFTDKAAQVTKVQTLEEREHPRWYHRRNVEEAPEGAIIEDGPDMAHAAPRASAPVEKPAAPSGPAPGHVTFAENQKGVSFDALFGPWLDGAADITPADTAFTACTRPGVMPTITILAFRAIWSKGAYLSPILRSRLRMAAS